MLSPLDALSEGEGKYRLCYVRTPTSGGPPMTARRAARLLFVLVFAPLWASAQSATGTPKVYYPDAAWQHKTPAEAGIGASLLKDAIDFAVARGTQAPRDLTLNLYQR